VPANTAGENDGSWRVADVGWFLFEAEVTYDYLSYDEEFDELTIAHPGGLIVLGHNEGVECLSVSPIGELGLVS
jgi:hypothetical protein